MIIPNIYWNRQKNVLRNVRHQCEVLPSVTCGPIRKGGRREKMNFRISNCMVESRRMEWVNIHQAWQREKNA
jgi:hypothetical protein